MVAAYLFRQRSISKAKLDGPSTAISKPPIFVCLKYLLNMAWPLSPLLLSSEFLFPHRAPTVLWNLPAAKFTRPLENVMQWTLTLCSDCPCLLVHLKKASLLLQDQSEGAVSSQVSPSPWDKLVTSLGPTLYPGHRSYSRTLHSLLYLRRQEGGVSNMGFKVTWSTSEPWLSRFVTLGNILNLLKPHFFNL